MSTVKTLDNQLTLIVTFASLSQQEPFDCLHFSVGTDSEVYPPCLLFTVSGPQAVIRGRRPQGPRKLSRPINEQTLKPQAGGQHVFEKLNPERFPQCGGGVLPPDLFENSAATQGPAPFETAADSADDIHLMSLYTPQARDAVGGDSQIQATIRAAGPRTLRRSLLFGQVQGQARQPDL